MRLLISIAVVTLALGALLFSGAGCNQLTSKLPGNVAGQVLNEGGAGQGFVSVHLVCTDAETDIIGGELVENASDTGNFMFKDVPAGNYVIKVFAIGGSELPCDSQPFKVNVGKTVSQTVNITNPNKSEQPQE